MMILNLYGELSLEPKEQELIIKEGSNGFVAYFSNSKNIGIGKTEIEAMDNLKGLIDKKLMQLKKNDKSEELHLRHRKLWNY